MLSKIDIEGRVISPLLEKFMAIYPKPLYKIKIEKAKISEKKYAKNHHIWSLFKRKDTVVLEARSDYFKTVDGEIRDIFIVRDRSGNGFTVNREDVSLVYD